MGTAIVAIPRDGDKVWKISSEKKPHMTLLFLGETSDADNITIAEFVQHVTNTMINRFYMSVDHRGVLGQDEADVLFFGKKWSDPKMISEARNALLQNNVIRKAYDSVPQYEGWTPHLTLGYPENPAKKDEEGGDPDFYDVGFDRIGVWFGDFDGPEFVIPEENYGEDSMAMSETIDKMLQHHGIPGMKWGVRRTDAQLATVRTKDPSTGEDIRVVLNKKTGLATKTSVDADNKDQVQEIINKYGLKPLSNQEIRSYIDRVNLERSFASLTKAPPKKTNPAITFSKKLLTDIARENITTIAKAQAKHNLANELAKNAKTAHLAEALKPSKKKKKD